MTSIARASAAPIRLSKFGRAEAGTSQYRRENPVVVGADGPEGKAERSIGSAMASVEWSGVSQSQIRGSEGGRARQDVQSMMILGSSASQGECSPIIPARPFVSTKMLSAYHIQIKIKSHRQSLVSAFTTLTDRNADRTEKLTLSNHLFPAFSPPEAQLLTCASICPLTKSAPAPVPLCLGGSVCESSESAKRE